VQWLAIATLAAQSVAAVGATFGALNSWRNGRRYKAGNDAVRKEVQEVKDTTNGKMDKLLQLTASSSKAEGVLEEKERQHDPRTKHVEGGSTDVR
jgi:uncharacterized membrane protein YebE (DUF533 family)